MELTLILSNVLNLCHYFLLKAFSWLFSNSLVSMLVLSNTLSLLSSWNFYAMYFDHIYFLLHPPNFMSLHFFLTSPSSPIYIAHILLYVGHPFQHSLSTRAISLKKKKASCFWRMWILLKVFSVSIEMIMWLLFIFDFLYLSICMCWNNHKSLR